MTAIPSRRASPPPAEKVPPELLERLRTALAGSVYRVEEPLGRGGMSLVCLAQDTRRRRKVAVKVLLPELALTVGKERFAQEIEIAGRLKHPHILPIYESGEADGLFYYVMPFVKGGSLRTRLDAERQLALEDAVRIVGEVANALTFAHEHSVVHRDVKPENILFVKGRAVVCDFGIAWTMERGPDGRLTGSGISIGTPAYMSPEQPGSTPDARSDVYSLGCVLYEMLTGEPPFTGLTAQMILQRQQVERPRPLRTVRPAIPAGLERIVLQSLAKIPADRFPTAAAFATAVASVPLDSALDASLAPNSVAVLPFDDESERHDLEYFCDGMTDAVIAALSGVSTLRVPPRRAVQTFKGAKRDIREIGRQLGVRTVLEGSVRTAEDRLRVAVTLTDAADGYQRWSERYDRNMTDVFSVQDEIARSIVGALQFALSGERDSPYVARQTESVEAYRLYLQGRHYWNRRFEGGLQKAIECFRGALERDPMYARAYSGLTDCFMAMCTYEFLNPKDGLPQAAAAVQRALELDDGIAEAHASRALLCMYRQEWTEAEARIKRSIGLDPEYATVHQFYSMWLAGHGQMAAGLAEIRRAQELDPLSPILSAAVGWTLYFAGRYDEAIESLRSTLQVHPGFAVARGMMGQSLVEVGLFDDGIRELKETALTFPPAVAALGYAYAAAGRSDEAREVLEQLDRRSRQAYMSPYGPAIVYAGLGEKDAAFEWLDKAFDAHAFYMILVAVNPMFRRIKDDPRFDALLRKMQLR